MSIFAHCERVKRNVRCTSSLSGGTGGRPGFLGSSMMQLSVPQETLASAALLCHNNSVPQITKTLRLRIKDKHANVLCRMARGFCTTSTATGKLRAVAKTQPSGRIMSRAET